MPKANAVTDSLTGCLAREEVEKWFLTLSERDKVGFLLVDIDHFKLINDCNGHGRGDEVLRDFGGFLRRRVGQGAVFRMGGDEFLVVLPACGKRVSQQFAQRLNHALAEERFRGRPDLRISLSIGISLFPADGRNLHELLTCADERLYLAKRGGRNRYCITDAAKEEQPVLRKPARLIGREKPFLLLREQLERMLGGNSGAVVVGGEGGVGKTFLCNKFLEYAGMRGGRIQQLELEDISFESQLVQQIIGTLFETERDVRRYLREGRVEYGNEIARLLDRRGIEGTLEAYRLLRGLISLLEVYARRSGSLTLFLDHFERGERFSIRLLDSLARTESDAPLLLIAGFGCQTPEECEELCARYSGSERVKSILLLPFSKEEGRTLVKTLLGSARLNQTLFEFAYTRSEGNPLLTREVLIAGIEQGIITPGEGEWQMSREKDRVALSRSIHHFLRNRLRSLCSEERELLQCASVIGKRFDTRSIAGLMRMDEETVAGLLRKPIALGVVDDRGGGRFSFRLMYQDAFYEQLPATERALMHKRLGQQLARSGEEEHQRRGYHHLRRAGEDALASRVASTLFRSAMANVRFSEARRYLDFILACKSTKGTERSALLPLAAKCYSLNGMHEEAIGRYREIIGFSPGRKNQLLLEIARLRRKQGKPSQALDELLAIHTRSPVLLCNTLHEMAETLMHMGRLEKAEEYARRALLLAQRWGKKKQEADGYYTTAGIFWYRGEYELAEDFLRKALSIYRGLGSEKEVALTMNRAGIVKWSSGSLPEAAELIEQAVEVFKKRAGVEEEHRAYTNLGILYEAMGRWKDAHAYYRRSLDMALFLNVVPLVCRNHNNIGTLLIKEGKFDDALDHLKKALSIRSKSGGGVDLASSYHNLGVAYLYQGAYGKAAHFLVRGRTLFEREGVLGMLISNLNALFELYTFQKDFRRAEGLRERILPLVEANGTELQQAQYLRVLARFHRLQGAIDESRRHARRSVALLDPGWEQYEKGKSLYELGLVLLEDGSRSEAERALRRARATFKQLGAKKALERVEHCMIQRGLGKSDRRSRRTKR